LRPPRCLYLFDEGSPLNPIRATARNCNCRSRWSLTKRCDDERFQQSLQITIRKFSNDMLENPSSDLTVKDAAARTSGPSDLQSSGSNRQWRNGVLPVYALFALSVSGPMFSRLEQRTSYLATLETVTMVLFIVLWGVVVPGLLLMPLAVLGGRHAPAARRARMWTVGLLVTLLVLGIFSHRFYGGGSGWLTVIVSLAGGLFIARQYERWNWMRSVLTVAALGSVVFPATLFMTFWRVSQRPVVEKTLTAGNPVPVVMVVFDCFCGVSLMGQDRQIDARRYPHFAELAKTSNWYRNCSTVHPRTNRAIPAILTGTLPKDVEAATVQQYPHNLFTFLNATGDYDVTSFEPFTALCPPDKLRDRSPSNLWIHWVTVASIVGKVWLHDVVPADLPFDTPRIPRIWFGLEHAVGVDRQQRQGLIRYGWDIRRDIQLEHFIDCLQDSSRPTFRFGHFALPHFPWDYLPSGRCYHADHGIQRVWGTEGILSEDWTDDEFVVLQAHQQHLLQLGYTDRMVGKCMEQLRATGLFDRCLLIVMADHGISFRQGMSGRLPSERNLADIMSVPLFIKLPGQLEGDTIDMNVQTTDVLPTILDVLKLNAPGSLPGQSVISPDFSEPQTKWFTDDRTEYRVESAFEARHQVLIEQLAKFGTGEDPLSIYRIGPHSELLGRGIGTLESIGTSKIEIRPVNFSSEVEYVPGDGSRLVPVFLEAKLDAQAPLPAQFAIAINDTIWGTTQTYRVSYLQRYWRVMLPESSLVTGMNRVRVFQIMETPQGVSLAECKIGRADKEPELPPEQ